MCKFIGSACVLAIAATLAACSGQQPQQQDQGQSQEANEATEAAPAGNEAEATPAATDNATATASAGNTSPPEFAQCKSCHSDEPGQNGIGPSLAGVFGTKAAEVPGYSFSDAMKASGLTWNEATLDRYLKSPKTVVPGTKMTFPGIQDDTKRAAVIAYLKSIA